MLLLAAPAAVEAQFTYTTNKGAITVSGYTGTGGGVVISNFVSSIAAFAFQGHSNLTSIAIPGSVTNIGDYAFNDCTSLTAITVNAGNPDYSSVGGVLFNQNQTMLVAYPDGVGGSYTISNTVTSIGDTSFSDSSLTSVTIPGSVTSIGYAAFADCRLTSISIPAGVTSIGEDAFAYCPSLTNITIPASVTSIGDFAFVGCRTLGAINVSTSNTVFSSRSGVLFNQNQTVLVAYPGGIGGSYTIPNTVTSIGTDAFYQCTSLTSPTIPASVTSIGDYAFGECFGLTSVYFKGRAPTADSTVFYYVTNNDPNATVYYLPGTTGWSNTFAGVAAVLWNPVIEASGAGFGIRNNQFGFNIAGTTNIPIVVAACSNLASPVWTVVQTLRLTNGSIYFSEPVQMNTLGRYYRISSQ